MPNQRKQGSLTLVGTGITMIAHLTNEAHAWISKADQTFYLVMHPLADEWIHKLNPHAESLAHFYQADLPREQVYHAMVAHIWAAVEQGKRVCVAFYGHPSVFVTPTSDLVQRGQRERVQVNLLPGISAEACLFADLALDPGLHGYQSYEASDFLLRPRRFDPTTPLVLWQIGVIGYFKVVHAGLDPRAGLARLVAHLQNFYPEQHQVTIYQAAILPIEEPTIRHVQLNDLAEQQVSAYATLYVPAFGEAQFDQELAREFGLL
ncbi:SAM-dependent methyltransferase [Herpetosiphon giganteus]|uniref:SAM-dependent methyltransferase n=1 Tax=Herpetosiphon giganteus TaxID=2029754 RepID=UPI0019574671|nr:SAM-dependent methyltransferase [Herpetosiphon giganteus]MBM7845221.1 uncharacterized protein YabN with tetrapyrrole methylase and pyrophosphatase domain [Herpetosiphon giganteus]